MKKTKRYDVHVIKQFETARHYQLPTIKYKEQEADKHVLVTMLASAH